MLYTFEMSESALARVDDYLRQRWNNDYQEYILGVEHRSSDSVLLVMIDCDESTATWLAMLI